MIENIIIFILYAIGMLGAILYYDTRVFIHNRTCQIENCNAWITYSWHWIFFVIFWPISFTKYSFPILNYLISGEK